MGEYIWRTLGVDENIIDEFHNFDRIANNSDDRFYVDNHPDMKDWELKQTKIIAFCSGLGLNRGCLEKTMEFEKIPYDDIIV